MEQANKNLNWYAVRIIKQIIIEGEPDKNLLDDSYKNDDKQSFEESLLLIKAHSENNACQIAESKTRKDNDFYLNAFGQKVSWRFVKIVDCYSIPDKLQSGTEIYSCIHTAGKNMTTDEFLEKYFKQD